VEGLRRFAGFRLVGVLAVDGRLRGSELVSGKDGLVDEE